MWISLIEVAYKTSCHHCSAGEWPLDHRMTFRTQEDWSDDLWLGPSAFLQSGRSCNWLSESGHLLDRSAKKWIKHWSFERTCRTYFYCFRCLWYCLRKFSSCSLSHCERCHHHPQALVSECFWRRTCRFFHRRWRLLWRRGRLQQVQCTWCFRRSLVFDDLRGSSWWKFGKFWIQNSLSSKKKCRIDNQIINHGSYKVVLISFQDLIFGTILVE